MVNKFEKKQKLAELKSKLEELEKVKLPTALKKFGQNYAEGGAWEVDPNQPMAADEVAVLTSLISDLKLEIARLEKELSSTQRLRK